MPRWNAVFNHVSKEKRRDPKGVADSETRWRKYFGMRYRRIRDKWFYPASGSASKRKFNIPRGARPRVNFVLLISTNEPHLSGAQISASLKRATIEIAGITIKSRVFEWDDSNEKYIVLMDNKFTPRRFLFYRFVTKKVLTFFFLLLY